MALLIEEKIAIGIITYNRNDLLHLALDSLLYLKPVPGVKVELIVVDNYKENHALEILKSFNFPFTATYLFEKNKGIPFARNSVIEKALSIGATKLAFIDDDEQVDSYWLFNLYNGHLKFKADVTIGRVLSVYGEEIPRWVILSSFFEKSRRRTGGGVNHAATCNVMYSIHVFKNWGLRFSQDFATDGGTDSLLAREIIGRSGKIVYVDDAIVREEVPAHRAKIKWILLRVYRCRANDVIQIRLAPSPLVKMELFRFLFSTLRQHLPRAIYYSLVGGLFMKKIYLFKGAISLANIVGVLGGVFKISYKEYDKPI